MIPGLTSKISEKSIAMATTFDADADAIIIGSTAAGTTFETIRTKQGIPAQFLLLINNSGNPIASVTTGNIQGAHTLADDEMTVLAYVRTTGKWHVNVSA